MNTLTHPATPRADDPHARLIELLHGYMPVQLTYVMARLQLAELLNGHPLTIAELSRATIIRPRILRRLMRGLAGVGLVALDGEDRIALTDMGALLDTHAPGSLRDVALHRGGVSFAAWGRLEHAIRTGRPAFEAAHGEPFFAYLRQNREAGAAFDGAMRALSQRVIGEVIADYDFTGAERVLDVGGGLGHFLAALLAAHPGLEGAVIDVPDVAAAALRELRRAGLQDRAVAIGGSFFEPLPAGYDVHLLKWILHNWDDDACLSLLSACRRALPDDGRLLVVEQLLPDDASGMGALHPAVAMDLMMLVNFADARERQLAEYEHLLHSSGFALARVVSLPGGHSVLECRPTEHSTRGDSP